MKTFFAIFLILLCHETTACTVGFGDFNSLAIESTHIFCGTVARVQKIQGYSFATVTVREVWRGAVPDTIVVATDNSSCGAYFKPGVEYVFFPQAPGENVLADWIEYGLPSEIWRDGPPLSVWTGSCATYERAGEATFITFGKPQYVANGLEARPAKTDELLALLDDPQTTNRVDIVQTLGLCKARLIADVKSGDPQGQARLKRTVDTLLRVGLENRENEAQLYRSALYAVGGLGQWANFALPMLISLYEEFYMESYDETYWSVLSRIGKNDPSFGKMLIRVANTSSVDEIRAFALGQFWYGNIPWQKGARQADEFIMDPGPNVRLLAIRIVVERTSAPDSLASLARLVLADEDPFITKQVIRHVIARLNENIPTRCYVIKATMDSPHEDVRKTGTRYWERFGADCP